MTTYERWKAKFKAAPESVKLLVAAGVGFILGALVL